MLAGKIDTLGAELRADARRDSAAKRLMTIPGIGPIAAMALAALSQAASTFRKGRAFAAWTGLTPKQFQAGGKERIRRTSNPLGIMLCMTLTGNGWVNATCAACLQ